MARAREARTRSRTRRSSSRRCRRPSKPPRRSARVTGVDLVALEALPLGGMERLEAVESAINALIAPESLRRDFFGHGQLVGTLYRAVKPDPAALEFAPRVVGIATLAAAIRAKLSPNPPDISTIMEQITGLLDESITGLTIRDAGPPAIDLSRINFEALAKRFKESEAQEHRPGGAQGRDPRQAGNAGALESDARRLR